MWKLGKRGVFPAICLAALSASPAGAATRLNPGTVRWAQAARENRADLLFLGDSITNYGTGGWTNGVARAAASTVGLCGSGLFAAPNVNPEVWTNYAGTRIWAGAPVDSIAGGLASLTPSGKNYDVDTNFYFLGSGIDSVKLDLTRQIDWHVFAASTAPGAQLQARRMRRVESPYSATQMQTSAPRTVGAELTDHVFRFDAASDPGQWNSFEFTSDSRDTAIYYTKLVQPAATGLAISGWSYSGGTTQTFRDAYYNHPRFTAAARNAFYDSLVAGNSGKLNVVITFGVNDALTIGPEPYGQSIRGLIADVKRDWNAAARDPEDLSFTLASTYQVSGAGYPSLSYYWLNSYRSVLDSIAAEDPQISFLDLWAACPTWQVALANGYLVDNVHPTAEGTRVYGEAFMRQFMPAVGDSDIDGDVDFNDLLSVVRNYERTADVDWAAGDFDGVGGVNFADLLLLVQNYGLNAAPVTANIESDLRLAWTLVPEPALVLPGLLLFSLRSRRA